MGEHKDIERGGCVINLLQMEGTLQQRIARGHRISVQNYLDATGDPQMAAMLTFSPEVIIVAKNIMTNGGVFPDDAGLIKAFEDAKKKVTKDQPHNT